MKLINCFLRTNRPDADASNETNWPPPPIAYLPRRGRGWLEHAPAPGLLPLLCVIGRGHDRTGRGPRQAWARIASSGFWVLPLAAVFLLAGCAATRPISDMAFGAGGAALANELSNGDPAAIAGGAAGGVLLSEGLHYAARKEAEKAYLNGYDKGRSDAVKQQYWLYVDMQRVRNRADRVRLYEVRLPEQQIDGVTFKPTTKYLRIEE